MFTNDAWTQSEDRNLYIQSVTVGTTTTLSTDGAVSLDRGTGDDAFDGRDVLPGQEALWWNAALRFAINHDLGGDGVTGTIKIQARGTSADGVWPTMVVRVNGAVALPVTVNSGTFQTYTVVAPNMTASSKIDVAFVNDAWPDPEDRNLFVRSISVDDVSYASSGSGVTLDHGSDEAAFDGINISAGQEAIWRNGALRFTVPFDTTEGGTVIVTAMGTKAAGVWPLMDVLVDGESVSNGPVSADKPYLNDYAFTVPDLSDAPQIDVVFLNDAYATNGPGTADNKDRNLFVDSINVEGRRIQPSDAQVTVDWGSDAEAFDGVDTGPGVYGLFKNGALRFDAKLVQQPDPFAALAPLRGEQRYYQDFSSGQPDLANLVPYDSIGNAGWGLRRSSAISVADVPGAAGGKAMRITAQMGSGDEAGQVVSGGMALSGHPQIYGRYTIRVRTDKDPGLATTGVVLLWPRNNNWPAEGEIDWYETWRDRLQRKPVDLVTHYVIDGNHQEESLRLAGPDGNLVDGSEWHTYQLDWRPSYLAVSVDGGPANIVTTDPAKIPSDPMHLTIQLDAWSPLDNPGNQPTLDQPVSMWVDWVKVERYPGLTIE